MLIWDFGLGLSPPWEGLPEAIVLLGIVLVFFILVT